jgi:ornithine cyclodeaminase/alanine dehydrogenase-like protein (mu-crystallin family)
MTLVLSEADVRIALDMPTAIEAVEQSFCDQGAGESSLHPRQRFALPDRGFLNYMAAADRADGWMGLKVYSVAHGVARFVVLLYRIETGELAALIEADYLGQMRTGAATGVATKYLSRPDARVAGIIGTGLQAHTQLRAISEVRKLDRILAYGRDPARRADFCQEMTELLGVPVIAAESAEEAVREAEIVITVTNAVKPVLSGAWLVPGTHVNAVGANLSFRRELDAAVVERANFIAVDSLEQARLEAGDLIEVFRQDAAGWTRVHELAEVISGKIPGRENAEQITLFKSLGIATWDIAVAAQIFKRAERENLGRHISLGDVHTVGS